MSGSKARSGKGSRPFSEVQWEIFRHIDETVDSSLLGSVKCLQIRRRVADQFVPYLYEDAAALLRTHNLKPGVKTRDPELRAPIKETRTRFRGEFESWMQGLSIRLPED
jgi:hypothetical protein